MVKKEGYNLEDVTRAVEEIDGMVVGIVSY